MEKATWELAVSILQTPGLRSRDQRKSQGKTQACHLTPPQWDQKRGRDGHAAGEGRGEGGHTALRFVTCDNWFGPTGMYQKI